MKKILLAGMLILANTTATAALFTEGALARVNRISNSGTTTNDGGAGVSSASVLYDPVFGGNQQGFADATLSATNFLDLMELDALSRATSTVAVNASAYGIQRYRYTGAASTTLTATGTFRGNLSSATTAGLTGRMAIISAVGDMDDMVDDFEDTSLWTDLFGMGEHAGSRISSGQTSAYNDLAFGNNGPGNKNLVLTQNFSVNPNDEFFIYGALLTHASDSNSTLSDAHALSSNSQGAFFALTGSTDLELVAPVPVPAAVWLMGSALLGLVGFKRRKAV